MVRRFLDIGATHALDGPWGGLRPATGPHGAWAWLRGRGFRRTKPDVAILLGIGAVAVLVRAVPVLLGGGLRGLHGYDDGVYFGGAVALTEGLVPYRDYLLLHPPGQIVALAPFAVLGAAVGDDWGFAAGRVAMMLLGGVSTILAGIVAGRYLRIAGVVAALVYATWSTASTAERTTDLHAIQAVLLLAACLALTGRGRIGVRNATVAGIALGVATSVQLWQALSVIILLGWIFARAPVATSSARRLVAPATFGMAAMAAFVVVCLPFFVAAPGEMVRYTVVDQVGRPAAGIPWVERIRALEGLPQTTQLSPSLQRAVPDVAVIVVAVVALAVLIVTVSRLPWTRPWGALALAQAVTILLVPSFFNDYTAFAAPAASLTLGTAMGVGVVASVRRRWLSSIGIAAIGLIVLLTATVSTARVEGRPLPLARLTTLVADVRCVSADVPAVLVLTGALRRDVRYGCRVVLDPTGVRYDTDRGHLAPGSAAASLRAARGYQRAMQRWYGEADAALFVRSDAGFSPETRALIAEHLPRTYRIGVVEVRLAER